MEMIIIPEGWFTMGSEGRYLWERPRHRVFVDGFRIAKTPVTCGEYEQFLQDTRHPEPGGWNDPLFNGENKPVVAITWFDAMSFCEWFSRRQGKIYRLPTEAEWEKACRGGLEDAEYAWGNDAPETFDYFRRAWNGPRAVGQGAPNGYGLFNMGDNVHEWCLDWYSETYYSISPERNPAGPAHGHRRVSRGGSWRHQIKASRAAHRSSLPPGYAYTDYGFRIVQSAVFAT